MISAGAIKPRCLAVWSKDLDGWDFKSALAASFRSAHSDFVPLGHFIEECVESVRPWLVAEKHWPVYGVNNRGGVFFSHRQQGSEFNASYKSIRKDWFFHNPTRANVGSMGRVPEVEEDAITSPEYQVWRIKDENWLPEYVEILIQMPFFSKLVQVHRVGAVKERLYTQNLMQIPVPCQSKEFQLEIISRWRQAQAEIAAALQEADKIGRRAEKEFLHGLGLCAPDRGNHQKYYVLQWHDLDRWGVDVNRPAQSLDVSASDFPVHTLGELIADLENGWSPQCLPRPALSDEWGVLKLGAVSFGVFDQEENKALPERLQPIPRYEVRPGDLLISRANIARYVGACALVKETRPHLMLCDKIFRVAWKAHSAVLPEFLDEVMKIPHLRHQIENALTGSSPTMKNISKPALLALRLPIPPKEEQQRLIDLIAKQRHEAATMRTKSLEHQNSTRADIEAMILGTKRP